MQPCHHAIHAIYTFLTHPEALLLENPNTDHPNQKLARAPMPHLKKNWACACESPNLKLSRLPASTRQPIGNSHAPLHKPIRTFRVRTTAPVHARQLTNNCRTRLGLCGTLTTTCVRASDHASSNQNHALPLAPAHETTRSSQARLCPRVN